MPDDDESNPKGLRVIKTARDEESINRAARKGFRPLIKPVVPSPEIRSKFAVFQSRSTGEIQAIGDFRCIPHGDYDEIIGWTNHYPHSFPEPFAAYLIPRDIGVEERVYVEDLIEDFVGASWNQGDVYRLDSCEAIWDGKDLVIQYDPEAYRDELVG